MPNFLACRSGLHLHHHDYDDYGDYDQIGYFYFFISGSTVDLQARLVMMFAVYPSAVRKERIIGRDKPPQP